MATITQQMWCSGIGGTAPRANFMHGSGYEDGAVQIQIRGAGFMRSDGIVDSAVQTHKYEIPALSWPVSQS